MAGGVALDRFMEELSPLGSRNAEIAIGIKIQSE